jgi:hypothetical protein
VAARIYSAHGLQDVQGRYLVVDGGRRSVRRKICQKKLESKTENLRGEPFRNVKRSQGGVTVGTDRVASL